MFQARAAQENLATLQKSNAPIDQQIHQAALFAGISFQSLDALNPVVQGGSILYAAAGGGNSHQGRREWSLRWLMKKMHLEAKLCSEAWRLLCLLIRGVPLRIVARVLSERKLIAAVRQVLAEVVVRRRLLAPKLAPALDVMSDSTETVRGSPVKEADMRSRKRRRDSETADESNVIRESLERDTELVMAVHDVVQCLVRFSKHEAWKEDGGNGEAFIAEYVKAVIRTTNDEAAKMLGAWLDICRTSETTSRSKSWLSPFIDIWLTRVRGANDTVVFATYCLRPSLLLLSRADQFPEWKSMLEQLLARNFIVPAKAAYISSMDTDLLKILVGESISIEPLFAPILLDIAIRSLRPYGRTRRLSHQDTIWLKTLFTTLRHEIGKSMSSSKNIAICQMLQSCLDHGVVLESLFLREITTEFALTNPETDWFILALVIRLDSNVFFIPNNSEGVLGELLGRITLASIEGRWPDIASRVVDDVLVPLMEGFSKARDLVGFIHYWYEQLVKLQTNYQEFPSLAEHFSAWEDEALQLKMREIMEVSLTIPQITEVFKWVQKKIDDCPSAAFVVLDAISGAVAHDRTIDALILGVWGFLESYESFLWCKKRNYHRLWRIASHCLKWLPASNDSDISEKCVGIKEKCCESPGKWIVTINPHIDELRYWYSWWTAFADSCKPGHKTKVATLLEDAIGNDIVSRLTQLKDGLRADLTVLGFERWGDRNTRINKGTGWTACALVNMTLAEYPKVLELLHRKPSSTGEDLFKNIIWLASATTPFTASHCKAPWLQINHDVFPKMWMKLLQDDWVLNNLKLIGCLIDSMLDCGYHIHNPIEKSQACNGFVINCLHKLPLEIFSKSNREFILKAWQPESPDPAHNDAGTLSYKLATIDPAVLSLKAKMMQLPTLSEGIKFQDLVNLADHLILFSSKPKIVLPIFAELAKLSFGHIIATIGQPRSREYVSEIVSALGNWLRENSKVKTVPSYVMIRLAQTAILALSDKAAPFDDLSKQKVAEITIMFKSLLLSNLQRQLQKPKHFKINDWNRSMSLYSTMDALDALGVCEDHLANLLTDIKHVLILLQDLNPELKQRLEVFITLHCPKGLNGSPRSLLNGDPKSSVGRISIRRMSQAMTERMTEAERLQLVHALLGEGILDSTGLKKLVALRNVIISCEDSRNISMANGGPTLKSLSSTYSTLAAQLCQTSSVRRFCLIIELMEFILRSKPRAITQYNIDTTLSCISVLCTRHSASLSASRAGTIYHRLTRLLHAVLTSHRIKTQGRFHVLVQALQALLHCLFIPLYAQTTNSASPPTSTTTFKSIPFPPWIGPTRRITPTHATEFTKLITLICNPSPSAASQITSIAQSSSLPLTSASKTAQHLAAQHMPLLLSTYIHWTLDLRLSLPANIKEKLTPGWWAVLDTMTVDGRRLLGEAMESNGRAVLRSVVADWTKWGRWVGH